MPELNEAGSFSVESVFNPDPMAIDNSFFYFSTNQIEVNYLKFLFNNHYQKLIWSNEITLFFKFNL